MVGEGRVEGRERRHISLNAHLEKTRRKRQRKGRESGGGDEERMYGYC